MINYSDIDGTEVALVRGSRWPAGGGHIEIEIENDAWPAGPSPDTNWEWRVFLSRTRRGGVPDLVLIPDSVSLAGTTITLQVHATGGQTNLLPEVAGKRDKYFVEVRSAPGLGGTTTTVVPGAEPNRSYYDVVAGFVWVRNPAGEA